MEIKSINLTCELDGVIRNVEIVNPHMSPGSYTLKIDNYHHGQMLYVRGEWLYYMHPDCPFFTADLQILSDMIEEQNFLDSTYG